MPENWKTYKLKDLTSVITKGTTPSTYGFGFEQTGINYIRAQSLSYDGKIDDSVFSFISEEAHKKLKRSQLQPGDILFSMAGAYLGMTGMVKASFCPANTNQAVGIIRINNSSVSPKFVEYLLRNPSTVSFVNAQSGQSAQPNINLAEIGNLTFEFPPLQEQKSIASILSALDDKIELNLQMNKTLEEMAMALYKHWFVDFGPFKDGEFVDSELGEIPKGWEVKTVQDFGVVITGKTPSKKFPEHFGEEIAFVTPTDFKSYGKHITTAARGISKSGIEKHKNSILPENSVIVTSIGSDMGKVAVNKDRCLTNQQINSLITEHYLYLYLFFKSNYNLLKMLAGDGTTMPIINKTSFQNIKVILPPQNILKEFETQIQNWDEQMHLNTIENQTLTQLRDTLLPKLISGEVRVKDVEKTLSEVL